ncbi:MAG: WbqC family protein [Methylophilaceae bacterium]|nr:WbqC family protein [Methyloradius sp.]
MKLAIMQPYFLPYIGYFQLIASVDVFVIYDNIKYTKKGWINRNRMLQNGKDVMFSLPLKSDSDYLFISQRELSTDFKRDRFLNQITELYKKAPFFDSVLPIIRKIIQYQENNLFLFLQYSIISICEYLELKTSILVSSGIALDHDLKAQNKVLSVCHALKANTYINAIGGKELYSKEVFEAHNLELKFLSSQNFSYIQFGDTFVPWLSILDVLMFNSKDAIQKQLWQVDFV